MDLWHELYLYSQRYHTYLKISTIFSCGTSARDSDQKYHQAQVGLIANAGLFEPTKTLEPTWVWTGADSNTLRAHTNCQTRLSLTGSAFGLGPSDQRNFRIGTFWSISSAHLNWRASLFFFVENYFEDLRAWLFCNSLTINLTNFLRSQLQRHHTTSNNI